MMEQRSSSMNVLPCVNFAEENVEMTMALFLTATE